MGQCAVLSEFLQSFVEDTVVVVTVMVLLNVNVSVVVVVTVATTSNEDVSVTVKTARPVGEFLPHLGDGTGESRGHGAGDHCLLGDRENRSSGGRGTCFGVY